VLLIRIQLKKNFLWAEFASCFIIFNGTFTVREHCLQNFWGMQEPFASPGYSLGISVDTDQLSVVVTYWEIPKSWLGTGYPD
jgi:hypothetical protein